MTIAQQFIEKGRAAGREEGQKTAVRESVLEVLEARFGPVPDDLSGRVAAGDDLSALHGLLRRAARCSSPGEFRSAL